MGPIYATTIEYIPVDVTELIDRIQIDVTVDAVFMAFVAPDGVPTDADWFSAVWETDSTGEMPVYTALCLVSPSFVNSTFPLPPPSPTLTAGNYAVFVKVTDSPAAPVLKVPGLLTVI